MGIIRKETANALVWAVRSEDPQKLNQALGALLPQVHKLTKTMLWGNGIARHLFRDCLLEDVSQEAMIKISRSVSRIGLIDPRVNPEGAANYCAVIVHNNVKDALRHFFSIVGNEVRGEEILSHGIWEAHDLEADWTEVLTGRSFSEKQREQEEAEKKEKRHLWIEAQMRKLPPRQRETIQYRYADGLSESATATKMRIGEGTVKQQSFIVRRKLDTALAWRQTKEAE